MTRALRPEELPLALLARAVMGEGAGQAALLLTEAQQVVVTAESLAAVQHAFAVGWVRSVVRGGGGRRERFASAGAGRLWERHAPPERVITASSVWLLAWALAEPLGRGAACPLPPPREAGDRAVVFLLARLLAAAGLPVHGRIFRVHPLVRLCWPTTPGMVEADDAAVFAGLTEHALEVEAWCGWITDAVLEADAALPDLGAAVASDAARRRVYAAWLSACDAAGRPDLALPLVDAAVRAMERPAPQVALPDGATLAQRSAAARACVTLAELTLTLAARMDALGERAFFDDGHAEAQALRQRWSGLKRARRVAEARVRGVAGV